MNPLQGIFSGDSLRRTLANAGWLYFDQISRALVVLVAFGAVARRLGPEQFGVLSYAVALPAIFLPVAMLGLDFVLVRDLVRLRDRAEALLGTGAWLKLAGALLAVGLAVVGMIFVPADHPARPLAWITLLTLLAQPFLLFDFHFQSQTASKYPAMARLIACLVANGGRLWLALTDAPLVWFAWAAVAEAVLYALGLAMAYWASGAPTFKLWRNFDAGLARRLLADAWPLFLADVAIALCLRVDQLLLSSLAGAESLGRYAAAFRLADAAEFFSLALINSYFPRLIVLHGQGGGAFEAALKRFFQVMTWFSLAVAVVLSATAPWVVQWVLGPQFAGVAPVLALLTWANIFVTQVAVRGKWFLMEGRQRQSLVFFVIGAAVHLSGVWMLAPRWGALGVAGSFFITQIVMVIGAPFLFASTREAAVLALRSFLPRRR
ncbi:MAG TPA: flippase [Opitutaceae bacterium]